MSAQRSDVLIIGGGIVGLATAYQAMLKRPDRSITLLEKEGQLAAHQTGHNSGVLHSGIYYQPGSLKAENCRLGKLAMQEFCAEHAIDFDVCGKVIVALDESELPALERIQERGLANRVACERIGPERLAELEPHAAGIAALHVPEAGIVDYRQVCARLGELLRAGGHQVLLGTKVRDIRALSGDDSGKGSSGSGNGSVVVTERGEYQATTVINCAGLYCDRVTRFSGQDPGAKIVPFRGEYYDLAPAARKLCRNLIYPVPDPSFPFLGVHFTRMIDGSVECGPNAVLAFRREGYRKLSIHLGELFESLTYPGFLRLARRHWRTGFGEMWRSFSKRAFVRALQRLVPEIRAEDLTAAPAGVRAQALQRDGSMVDDFLIRQDERVINVCNAPSPAATSALNIGALVAARI